MSPLLALLALLSHRFRHHFIVSSPAFRHPPRDPALTLSITTVLRRIKISKTPTRNSSSKRRNTKNRSRAISVERSRSTVTSRILASRVESVRRICSTSSRRIHFTMTKSDTRKDCSLSWDRCSSTSVFYPRAALSRALYSRFVDFRRCPTKKHSACSFD